MARSSNRLHICRAAVLGGLAALIGSAPALAAKTTVHSVEISFGWDAVGLVFAVFAGLALLAWFVNHKRESVLLHAFGLPPGTIRAVLALSLVGLFVVFALHYSSGAFIPSGLDEKATQLRVQLADKGFVAI